jgi:hypothetical protein
LGSAVQGSGLPNGTGLREPRGLVKVRPTAVKISKQFTLLSLLLVCILL